MTDNLPETTEAHAPQSREEGGEQNLDNSPGSQLRRAREKAGISREELSRRLCMTGNKLELLESDEYTRLPGALYVRGYIRNICKELNIDVEPVLQSFSGYCAAEEESREIVAHISRGPVVRERKRGLGGLALLPLLLVGGIFWWMYGRDATPPAVFAEKPVSDRSEEHEIDRGEMDSAGISAASLEVASAGTEVAQDAVPEEQVLSEGEELEEEPAAEVAPVDDDTPAAESEQEVVAEPQVVVAEPAEEPVEISQRTVEAVAPVGESAELQLTFDEDSWVEVKDASGAVLLAKLKPAGSEVVLSGQPPFQLMLGNAGGARVRYRGELVDSAPVGSRRTRRLTVGE